MNHTAKRSIFLSLRGPTGLQPLITLRPVVTARMAMKRGHKLPDGYSHKLELNARFSGSTMTTAQALYDKSLEHIGGNGHPTDYELAFALNEQAAAQGHPDAILAMGWFYFNGFGTPRDLRSAERWYRRSARSGEPKAMFSLGEIACDETNFESAHYWFELAVKRGHVRALYWLGKLYWRGLGVARDKAKALRLFEQAAHANAPEAKRFLRFRNRRKYVTAHL